MKTEIETHKGHQHKNQVLIYNVDVNKITSFLSEKKGFKNFIG